MAAKKSVKRANGRPPTYRAAFAEQAYKLCLLGATDIELGSFFGVSKESINDWKRRHPEFKDALLRGKSVADAEVAHSLFKRATGYTGKKTVTASFEGTVSDIRVVDDYVGPDTTAASLWLRNRQSAKWRDKTEQAITGADGGPLEIKQIVVNGR